MSLRKRKKRKKDDSCYIVQTATGSPFPFPLETLKLQTNEGLCLQCGLCCRNKIYTLDSQSRLSRVKFLSTKCKFLLQNNKCGVYDKRNECMPTCGRIADALSRHAQPAKCAYVQTNWEQLKSWYIIPDSE